DAGGGGLGAGDVGRGGGSAAEGAVRPVLVVGDAEDVELGLPLGQRPGRRLLGEPSLEALMKALDLPAGLGVVRAGILLLHAQAGQFGLEPVASRPASQS